MPVVSIVIPTYNHERFVLSALESVFAQTYRDFEVIVVDDGSPDQTGTLLAPLAASGKIRFIRQRNAGQAIARNRGLQDARGTFVSFLDDDDLWKPGKLERQVSVLSSNPGAVLTYGYLRTFSDSGGDVHNPPSPTGDVFRAFLRRNWIWSPGQTLIRTAILREIGGFDPSISGADDWDLYIRLAAKGTFVYEPFEALAYRLHSGNASRNLSVMYRHMQRVRSKHLGPFPTPWNFRDWVACSQYIADWASSQLFRRIDGSLERKLRSKALRELAWACWVKPRLVLTTGTVSRFLKACLP